MTNIDHAAKIISDTLGVLTLSAENTAYKLAKEGLLMPDGMTYEHGDNGWDGENSSPMHWPVEPSCRDDDHVCPEPAPPRYRRLVGPWEEIK